MSVASSASAMPKQNRLIEKNLLQALSKLFINEGLDFDSTCVQPYIKKYKRHGDLLMMPSAMFVDIFKSIKDQDKLMKCIADVFKVKRIAIEGKILPDGTRTPFVKLVLGDNGFVTHIDNKIRYSFDVTKCMFSSGNITEKIRMSKLNCEDEVVVDMFAGIGYFTLPLLVHAKAKLLYACDWNPNAIEALKYNIVDNKVADRCVVLEGDNRKVAPVGVANRVVLGLIPTAEESYEAACHALNPFVGGIFHIHGNVSSKEKADLDESIRVHSKFNINTVTCNRKLKPEWLRWAIDTAERVVCVLIDKKSPITWKACINHIERVKSYAPHVDHLVLDLTLSPNTIK